MSVITGDDEQERARDANGTIGSAVCEDRGDGRKPRHVYVDGSGRCACGKGPDLSKSVVVGDLRRRESPPLTSTTKLAITIDLDALAALTREYLAQLPPRDRLESQLRFSHFLMYLRKKKEQETITNGTKSTD